MQVEEPAATGEQLLQPDQRRRGQSALIRTAMGAVVFNRLLLMRVSSLFLMSLGGTARDVGILRGIVNLGWLGQLWGMQLVPKTGKVRLLRWGRVVTAVPVAFLIYLAASGRHGTTAVVVAIVAYGAVGLARMIGQTAWWPLLQDNTAGDAVGRFFARLRTITRGIEIVVALLLGVHLARKPDSAGFILPFTVGLLSLGWVVWFLRKVPESPVRERPAPLWLRMRLVLKAKPVRCFLAFTWQYRLIVGLMRPFWVVALKEAGLNFGEVLLVMTVQGVGNVLGLKLWGGLVDRHGGRSTLSITIAAQALLGLAWLAIPGAKAALVAWAVGYFLVWGFLQGGFMMGRTWAMLNVVPSAHQTAGFTLTQGSGTIMTALGSFVGGAIFHWLLGNGEPGLRNGLWYLAIVQMAVLSTFITRARLAGFADQTPARELLRATLRRALLRQGPDE